MGHDTYLRVPVPVKRRQPPVDNLEFITKDSSGKGVEGWVGVGREMI